MPPRLRTPAHLPVGAPPAPRAPNPNPNSNPKPHLHCTAGWRHGRGAVRERLHGAGHPGPAGPAVDPGGHVHRAVPHRWVRVGRPRACQRLPAAADKCGVPCRTCRLGMLGLHLRTFFRVIAGEGPACCDRTGMPRLHCCESHLVCVFGFSRLTLPPCPTLLAQSSTTATPVSASPRQPEKGHQWRCIRKACAECFGSAPATLACARTSPAPFHNIKALVRTSPGGCWALSNFAAASALSSVPVAATPGIATTHTS